MLAERAALAEPGVNGALAGLIGQPGNGKRRSVDDGLREHLLC